MSRDRPDPNDLVGTGLHVVIDGYINTQNKVVSGANGGRIGLGRAKGICGGAKF